MAHALFSLHDELVRLQENDLEFEQEVEIEKISQDEVDQHLDALSQALVEDVTNVVLQDVFDLARSFIKHLDQLRTETIGSFVDLLPNRFIELLEEASQAKTAPDLDQYRLPIEIYGFLLCWLMERAERRSRTSKQEKVPPTLPAGGRQKGKSLKTGKESTDWNWDKQRAKVLAALAEMMKIDLHRIIVSSAERDCIVSMVLKSLALALEEADVVKNGETKAAALQILELCAKKYESASKGVQSRISQFLREEHLAEPIAEFLVKASESRGPPDMLEAILRESRNYEFFDNTDNKAAKAFGKFIVRLSELAPERVLKGLVHLQVQMDSNAYCVRISMIEVFANLIHLTLSTNGSETSYAQMISIYNVLEERFRDSKAFVRSRLLQVLARLTEPRETGVSDIPLERWMTILKLCVGRLHDKTSNVRKNAIKLLTKMLENSPFSVIATDKGRQNLTLFKDRKEEIMRVIKEKFPNSLGLDENCPQTPEEGCLVLSAETAVVPLADDAAARKELGALRRFLQYYTDGIAFLSIVKRAVPTLCELIASNTKTEVVECMKFFVAAFKLDVEGAKEGILIMVHKVWDKDNDEEGVSIRDSLVKSYLEIYFEPTQESVKDRNELIVHNLIMLIQDMNLADMISFEHLLGLMMLQQKIPVEVIELLWAVFSSRKKEVKAGRRRGALALLSMLGKVDRNVIVSKKDLLLKYGLGEPAEEDLLLAKYACVTLQQLGQQRKMKGAPPQASMRLATEDVVFRRISSLLLQPCRSFDWFGFAEQGINTIYALAEHPDGICGEFVRILAERIFSTDNVEEITRNPELLQNTPHVPPAEEAEESASFISASSSQSGTADAFELSKLCFLVGHIAIKQVSHLEAIETDWKRRKVKDATRGPKINEQDELDQVVGTTEDDFSDDIAFVREEELLYDSNSLLGVFGPVIQMICRSNISFNFPILQIMATLALCKLMCVSSRFCEENLQLLLTILEKSTDAIIRSNIIIGLGDMTVSFNTLIDQNIAYLYKRLSDPDPTVKKNTLMVLTHLILNGMVKVKSQLSEMAKCLEDPDKRISDLAKLFFTELSTKDNAVYNNLPDIISTLSRGDTGVTESQFRSIMKFILDFIKKEKQNEAIVEKLCLRFKASDIPRQWQDIGYCLSLIPFTTERCVKKLIDALPLYQDKLHDDILFKHIQDIILKVKKLPKTDIRQSFEEFEGRIEQIRLKCQEDESAVNNARTYKRSSRPQPLPGTDGNTDMAAEDDEEEEESEKGPLKTTAAAKECSKKQASSKSRRLVQDDESSGSESDFEPLPPKRTYKKSSATRRTIQKEVPARRTRNNRRTNVEETQDSDSDFESPAQGSSRSNAVPKAPAGSSKARSVPVRRMVAEEESEDESD
ncbi:non-SMC mitotic condensation complex subunit 1-domain-containing protein [Zopfochytrium polystomum]|nr:non-SMC mitotic condensation complex subunit 1-domain-containing protein [Zopfochytrium polystomum]